MEDESEMIRQQMDETRTALNDKVQMLEDQVAKTAQAASRAVEETVASAKEIVHDSLQTVRDSMHENVETVMNALDLQRQVEQRPWTMLAGATALGYFGGYVLNDLEARSRESGENRARALLAEAAARNTLAAESRGFEPSAGVHAPAALPVVEMPSWFSRQSDKFHPEISQLKALVVGRLLGIVRDAITNEVPKNMERQVGDIINKISVKIAGRVGV